MTRWVLPLVAVVLLLLAGEALAQNPAVTIQVDAAQERRPIDPRIYGLNHADAATLSALNSPLNRFGGNRRSRYNWQQNVDSTGSDYFFLSFPFDPTPGEQADSHVGQSASAGAEAMITVPMIDYIARTDAQRNILCSFRQSVYGAQTGADPFNPDCGSGILLNGQPVVGNNPLDANAPNSPGFQSTFVQHLVATWGLASNGGVRYYLLDNEHAIWHQTHRDVRPVAPGYDEMTSRMLAYARTIKGVDPGARVVGPEEFGWTGYFLSGLDIQTCDAAEALGDFTCYQDPPDRAAHGGRDYVAFILDQFRLAEPAQGRLLDVFSLHYYPQAGGVFSDAVDAGTQDLRSRSTRALWDPTYADESWIGEPVRLIPRMKQWVADAYPETATGITEYHWGAENHINGGTAQADVLGIFGREGLDLATLYTDGPLALGSFLARAFQIYRNYDGQHSTFGSTRVRTVAAHGGGTPLADQFGVYGAVRSSDGALTLMVISKYRSGDTPIQVNLANFPAGATAEVWRFSAASGGAIARLADITVGPGGFAQSVPAQSVTLFLVRPAAGSLPGVTLALNQASFKPGETLILTGTLSPGFTPGLVVDVYVIVRLPNNDVYSWTGAGLVPGFVPIVAGITPAAFDGEVLRHTWGGGEPIGGYVFQAGLTEAGTGNIVGSVASVASRPFVFAP
jgi:hypothetical protein